MQHRIVIEDGMMMVMDNDGNGYDCHVLGDVPAPGAEEQIDRWADEYRFDVARAKREIRNYVQELEED